jgi:hypothetical protein
MLYTFVNLQKIIDTLPCYEKTRLETEGVANVQVCLDDIWENLPEFEKIEFIRNHTNEFISNIHTHDIINWDDFVKDNVRLDDFDIDDIIAYIDSCGYTVSEY